MKISDLLGEGWESDERSGEGSEPSDAGPAPTPPAPPPPVVTVPPEVADPTSAAPLETRAPDVITSLAAWAPAPEPREAEKPDEPVSARAQLADLAAGLALPTTTPVEEEPGLEPTDELGGLHVVVDDLLPDATKRKGSPRGSSRSGSRRRGR